jgi:hypothetical protein
MQAWAGYLDELRDDGKVIPTRECLIERQADIVARLTAKTGVRPFRRGHRNNSQCSVGLRDRMGSRANHELGHT